MKHGQPFMGLAGKMVARIAQYLRDLPVNHSSNGRPWQPPYQPGPNADNNAYEWAAGQGLENVLENEQELLNDLFGSTDPSETQIRNAINDFNGNTNIRTQRIAVQFPDWNEWLPVVHPKDILTASEYNTIKTAFDNLRNSVNSSSKINTLNNKTGVNTPYANNGLFEALGVFAREIHKVIEGDYTLTYPRSPYWADNSSNQAFEDRKRSLAHWYGMKLFDVIQEFDIYDIADLKNIANADEETFQWPIREWAVFQNAAHITSGKRVNSYFLSDDTPTKQTKSIYLSSIWYQLQLTLTPGHRKGGQVEPNDYAYNLQHMHRLGARSGIYEPVRFFQNYLKAGEQRNNGKTPAQSLTQSFAGWNMRELSPWRLWSTGRGNTQLFDALPVELRKRLRDTFMDEVADKLLSFNENDWPRTSVDECTRTDFHLETRSTTPINGVTYGNNDCVFYDRRCGGGCEDANDAVEIDAAYTLLTILSDNNEIKEATFNKLRNWADARWDYTQWPTYNGGTTGGGGGSGPVAGVYYYIENRSSGRRLKTDLDDTGSAGVGSNVKTVQASSSGDFVQWELVSTGSPDQYFLVNIGSQGNKLWANSDPNNNNRLLKMQYGSWTGNYTRWKLVFVEDDNGTSYYHIQNVANNLNAWQNDNNLLEDKSFTGYKTQWRFIESGSNSNARVAPIADKIGEISRTEATKLSVFPNPASTVLNLFGDFESEEATLIDVMGRKITKVVRYGQIDISDLSSGMFVLIIEHKTFRIMIE